MKLVFFVARRYERLHDLDDLVQEGNIGLIKAAATFDESRGVAFSTWAHIHIRGAILRALTDTLRTIRIPSYLIFKIKQLSLAGDNPDSVKLDKQKITALKKIARQHCISLDQGRYADDDKTWGDTLEDTVALSPYDASAQSQLRGIVMEIITEALSEKERCVIDLRFGLRNGVEHSLAEIGKLLGTSIANVRSIEAKALRKLRNPKSSNRVRGLSIFAPVHP